MSTDNERRSQEIADTTRRFLTGLNTGGAVLTVFLATALIDQGIRPSWIVGPLLAFTLSITFVGVSLFLAKYRSIKRSLSDPDDKTMQKFKRWYMRSFTWDIASGIFFLLGVWCALAKISQFS
jgi:hypothetical protein